MNKTIKNLKENGQDYELYPTTDEILDCIYEDMTKEAQNGRYNTFEYAKYTNTPHIKMESMLDIGTGQGKIFNHIENISIKKKFGIEKSSILADNLIRNGIFLLGRDFLNVSLMDSKFDVVFSNPPYSIYKEWINKMLSEVDAKLIYLVIPERFEKDLSLVEKMKERGGYEILGKYDFSEADRVARAKVAVIKIKPNKFDAFGNWVKKNISDFKAEKIEFEEPNHKERAILNKQTISEALLDGYNEKMGKLLSTYKKLATIDFSILEQLGIDFDVVSNKIKKDVKECKNEYWRLAFDHMKEFDSRLTGDSKTKILSDIKEFTQLDFNEDNIRNIIIWVMENFNDLSIKQTLKLFDDLSYHGSIMEYKSNNKWRNSNWRYKELYGEKGKPEKFQLEYRIIASGSYIDRGKNDRVFNEHFIENDILSDIETVLYSLGFETQGCEDVVVRGSKYNCMLKDGGIAFEYKIYKNGNLHLKFNQKVMMKLNIEIAKINKWFKCSDEVAEEFNISKGEVMEYFCDGLKLMENSQLLLN